MEIKDLPQDNSALEQTTKELQYAKDESGKYTTGLSTGWDVKTDALNNAWNEINEQIEIAKKQVQDGEKSPIYYFMLKNLMDINLLKQYTGFFKFNINRHFKPRIFAKLSKEKIAKYAQVFNITTDELTNFEKYAG